MDNTAFGLTASGAFVLSDAIPMLTMWKLPIIIRGGRVIKNIHPGEVLKEEFLDEYGISQNRLGREIGMSPRAINEIVHGKRSITANSALRLARYFGTSAEFWLNLQASYDLEEAGKAIDLSHIKQLNVA